MRYSSDRLIANIRTESQTVQNIPKNCCSTVPTVSLYTLCSLHFHNSLHLKQFPTMSAVWWVTLPKAIEHPPLLSRHNN